MGPYTILSWHLCSTNSQWPIIGTIQIHYKPSSLLSKDDRSQACQSTYSCWLQIVSTWWRPLLKIFLSTNCRCLPVLHFNLTWHLFHNRSTIYASSCNNLQTLIGLLLKGYFDILETHWITNCISAKEHSNWMLIQIRTEAENRTFILATVELS